MMAGECGCRLQNGSWSFKLNAHILNLKLEKEHELGM